MGGWFSKSFDPIHDIPSLHDRVAIVTGANSGVGFQTALHLAGKGAKVYLTTRSEAKALDAIKRMEAENPSLKASGRLLWITMDLASVKSAKLAAESFMSKEPRLDILVNNAGMLASPYSETEEGVSTLIAANHLGPWEFTTTLFPILNTTAKMPGSDVRVINVSSTTHNLPPYTKFSSIDDFKSLCGPESSVNTFKQKMARYGQSKMANILFTKELQRRWDAEGIPAISIALHPGGVATEGSMKFLGPILFAILKPFIMTPYQGAITSLFAATSPVVKAEAVKWKGTYLMPYGKITKVTANAEDMEAAKNLWELSDRVAQEILTNGKV